MLALFDLLGLKKNSSAKCNPTGSISTKVTPFSMDYKTVTDDYNHSIKARIFVSKVIRS